MQAFESGPRRTENFVVVMGGLTDGLLPCGYVPPLAKKAAASGWATVQAVMRGSCERDLLHTRLLSRLQKCCHLQIASSGSERKGLTA